MIALQACLFLVAALAGTAVVLTRRPRHQALVLSFYGLVLTLLFATLQAPEVAIAQVAVGGVALPLMLLVAITSVRAREQ
jgi:energy-converting hydrogenase B subunit D